MKPLIRFGRTEAGPGEKVYGRGPVLDTGYEMPLVVINGAREGKTVLITAGIHGGEYPCIQCALEMAKEIDPMKMSGQLVMIAPVNEKAFYARVSYVNPEDQKNINRLFPGNAEGSMSDKIAYVLTHEYQARADFYFDLHGGDIHESLPSYVYYPGIGDKAVVDASKKVAETFDVHFMVKSSATTGAYNSCAILGTPGMLVELGGRGLWTSKEVEQYKKNMYNALRCLGLLPGEVVMPEKKAYVITKAEYLDAGVSGYWYPKVSLEEKVSEGQVIGVITDRRGSLLEEIRAKYDAIVVFLTTSLAIGKGEPIITYGI